MGEMTAVFGAPEWRARSGRKVDLHRDGAVVFEGRYGYIGAERVADAEEYFQAKRDAELGRWRSPLHPDYVVYLIGYEALVVGEHVGLSQRFERSTVDASSSRVPEQVAAAFFEAHPEPKPWQDASQGQIWELDVVGVSNWVAVEAGDSDEPRAVFRDPHTMVTLEVDDPAITAGRRIWPEDAS